MEHEPTTKIEKASGICFFCNKVTQKEVNREKKILVCKICKTETSLRD